MGDQAQRNICRDDQVTGIEQFHDPLIRDIQAGRNGQNRNQI